eukprot:755145-Prymnesium_polylepis.1
MTCETLDVSSYDATADSPFTGSGLVRSAVGVSLSAVRCESTRTGVSSTIDSRRVAARTHASRLARRSHRGAVSIRLGEVRVRPGLRLLRGFRVL